LRAAAVPARRHIRAAALAHYFEVAEAVGLNPQPLLRRVGLSRRMLVDPEQRIPLAAALQLLEASAEASGCADFGLRMAEARRLSDLGALSLLLTHLSSLRAVLQTLIHSRQLVGGTLALALVESGKSTVIREELVEPAAARSRQATELALGVLFRLCATLPGQRWNPQSVNFRHAAPADIQRHRHLFHCRLKFGSEFEAQLQFLRRQCTCRETIAELLEHSVEYKCERLEQDDRKFELDDLFKNQWEVDKL